MIHHTIEQLREISSKAHQNNIETQYAKVHRDILAAAKSGSYQCEVQKLYSEVKEKLIGEGFKHHEDMIGRHFISWYPKVK